jgi:hypothetical protein
MTVRCIIAGILGGIVMFAWTSIAHMFLPLGETGIKEIPNEEAVLSALKTNLGDQEGFYIFPGPGLPPDATREQKKEGMKRAVEKYKDNPVGMMIYHAPGRRFAIGRWLSIEAATELVEALIAVYLLCQTGIVSFIGRVAFVTTAGILAAIATNVSYWNWYGFPRNYTAAYMIIQVVGFLCVGIVAALVLPKAQPAE